MTKTITKPDKYGVERDYTNTYWTQKGRMFVYELLAKEGIVPVSVQEESEQLALVAV